MSIDLLTCLASQRDYFVCCPSLGDTTQSSMATTADALNQTFVYVEVLPDEKMKERQYFHKKRKKKRKYLLHAVGKKALHICPRLSSENRTNSRQNMRIKSAQSQKRKFLGRALLKMKTNFAKRDKKAQVTRLSARSGRTGVTTSVAR